MEKLSPKESVKGADTVLRGNERRGLPRDFPKGKPEAAKPRGMSPLAFAALSLPSENPSGAHTLPKGTVAQTLLQLLFL